jgi:hypothetical protein
VAAVDRTLALRVVEDVADDVGAGAALGRLGVAAGLGVISGM